MGEHGLVGLVFTGLGRTVFGLEMKPLFVSNAGFERSGLEATCLRRGGVGEGHLTKEPIVATKRFPGRLIHLFCRRVL